MSNYSGTIIECQPDWLTVSAHGEAKARLLLELGTRLAKEEQARGGKPRKWRSMGYEGIHVGRCTYGQRDTASTELMLSGDLAAKQLDLASALADGWTRLDLAVTWRADQPAPDLGPADYLRALQFRKLHPRTAVPWTVSDGDGGWTTYIGKRASEYHFREYNKEAQERAVMGKAYDGRYDRCWRFELETKASIPYRLVKKLQAAPDRAEWIRSYIHSYMVEHGLQPPFEVAGPLALIPGFRRQSDADSKLRHLAKNVRPTVKWLADQGYDDDLRISLGMRGNGATLRQLEGLLARPWPTMGGSGRENGPHEGGYHA